MKNYKRELGSFPCECGKAYSTAERFSDHVHACKDNPVEWKPSADYLAARAEEK